MICNLSKMAPEIVYKHRHSPSKTNYKFIQTIVEPSHEKSCFNPMRTTKLEISLHISTFIASIFEPRCEKTGLRGFRPGQTQTGLYNHRRWLNA